jgi:multidrug transporter EmrE-like cation transporter
MVLLQKLFPTALLLVSGLLLTIGDIILKKWVLSNSAHHYLYGLLFWIVALNMLAWSFRYKNIAVASMLMVIFNVLSLVLVSVFYFKENLSGREALGILLGIASVVLLEEG